MMLNSVIWSELLLDLTGLLICILAIFFLLRTPLENTAGHRERMLRNIQAFKDTYTQELQRQEPSESDDASQPKASRSVPPRERGATNTALIRKLSPVPQAEERVDSEAPDRLRPLRPLKKEAPASVTQGQPPEKSGLPFGSEMIENQMVVTETALQHSDYRPDEAGGRDYETVDYGKVEQLAASGMTPEQIAGALNLPRGEVALVLKVKALRSGTLVQG